MFNRRFLRIKVLQILYAHWAKSQTVDASLKEMEQSMNKTLDLFYTLLYIYVELTRNIDNLIEIRKNRITARERDLNPNKQFVENEFIKMLTEHESFNREIRNRKINLSQDKTDIKNLARDLIDSPDYIEYTESSNSSFEKDKKFVQHLFDVILYNSESLYKLLEGLNVYWTGDIDQVMKKISQFIAHAQEGKPATMIFPSLYKNEDDRIFARDLLLKSIVKKYEYEKIIESHVFNWDIDRITQTDRLVLILAVTEILNFPSIPVKVTINEYIEISKMYSSPKNAKFVNGVIDKTVHEMQKKQMFTKLGQGLL